MPRRRKQQSPGAHKCAYTREEAVQHAAAIRSGSWDGSPESRVNAYFDQYAKCWRIGKLNKWEANHRQRER
jgi:hypothetical protein